VGDLAENAAGEPYGRAWLDLQRYAASAVQFAGAEAALNAILAGLKSLLAELPQLLEWTLADDTPVANQETMAWLKQRGILPGAPAETQPAPPAPAPETWYPPAPPPSFDAAPSNGDSAGPLPPDAYDLVCRRRNREISKRRWKSSAARWPRSPAGATDSCANSSWPALRRHRQRSHRRARSQGIGRGDRTPETHGVGTRRYDRTAFDSSLPLPRPRT